MSLGIFPNKYFNEDIKFFEQKLKNHEAFTFSKFADGEWAVMLNQALNNNEFEYSNSQEFMDARDSLIDSFKYQHPNYHVGISCPCCQGQAFEQMAKYSGQVPSKLTWANLWVNSNYQYYLENIIPLFGEYNIVLVAHKDSRLDTLPFTPKVFCSINKNAWVEDGHKIEKLKSIIEEQEMKGWLFLFCCGPFGNILAHQLTEFSDNNTYLDIGSTLNPYLATEGFRRGYFARHKNMKPCVWR